MEKRYLANNQVEIFHYPGNHLHSFCISLYLKAGSMYEKEEENGISHFLEHIVIRNMNWIMGGKLYQYLDKLGLAFHACTYKEFIQFEVTGAKKHVKEAIEVLVKVFEPICLPVSEINIERKRIKAEIREDDEKHSLSYFTEGIVWSETSLSQTITGKSSQLDRMGKTVLQQTHQSLFSSGNLFLYVTGYAQKEDIDYLKKAVACYTIDGGPLEWCNCAPVPENFFCRDGTVFIKKSSDTVVRFSFDLDMDAYSQAAYTLLYDLLFDCENAKLHQELSEKYGYIYSFDSGMEQYSNIGNLYFQYEVQPSRLLESVEIVVNLFRHLKEGIGDELDYIKAAYIDNGELLLDHASNLNWVQAYEGHILQKVDTDLEKRKKSYTLVTAEEITKLTRSVFTGKNMVVTVKGKKSKKLEQELAQLLEQLDRE